MEDHSPQNEADLISPPSFPLPLKETMSTNNNNDAIKQPDSTIGTEEVEDEETTTGASCPSTTSSPTTEEGEEEAAASTTAGSTTSTTTPIEFDVGNGVDPKDFDYLYYVLKWVIPVLQLSTWICVLALPLIDNASVHLIWLWIIFAVQMLYASYGAFQCYHAINAMNQVKRVCLQYSEKKEKRTEEDKKEGDDDSTSCPAVEIPTSLASSEDEEENTTKVSTATTVPNVPLMSHVFIIPNYCEPEHILCETLGYLASHTWANRYTVVLACEDSEMDHHHKAERLITNYQSDFHRILYTSHILQTSVNGESRGKASNESWATRYISKEVELHPELFASTVRCNCCCCPSGNISDATDVLSFDQHSHDDCDQKKNDLELGGRSPSPNPPPHHYHHDHHPDRGAYDRCRSCVENFSSSQVMIHVLDADAHVHNAYTLEVEASCRKIIQQQAEEKEVDKAAVTSKWDTENRRIDEEVPPSSRWPSPNNNNNNNVLCRTIFAPPAIMSRNNLDVPAINRVQDIAWSATAFNNLTCFSKICFPVSNYSFCLKLAEDIDYWDATNETITEEMHFFLKAFFKTTSGRPSSDKNKNTTKTTATLVRVEPIYVPINMLNLNTGGSWWDNFKARFIQAERHARAVTEFAYCFRQLLQHPTTTTNAKLVVMKLIATWKVFVAMSFPPIIPFFVGVAAPFCQLIYWIRGPEAFAAGSSSSAYFLLQFTQFFGLIAIVIIGCQLLAYDVATRYANMHLYTNRQNMTWKQTLLPLPLVAINLWIYIVVPFALASFRSILPKRFTKKDTFVVSAKK